MKTYRISQIKALIRKDFLVRWRNKVLTVTMLIWPMLIFMMLYIIRLRYGIESDPSCQFPTRLLPTKNQVIPSAFSYICSIENKCLNAEEYQEYSDWADAPLHSAITMINIFVTDRRLYDAFMDLSATGNFLGAVTTLITSDHLDAIRTKMTHLLAMVPEIEQMVNYTFNIKGLFSDRETFVKLGYLLCNHPFPNTESIPLINDILYSEDFKKENDDELEAMPIHRRRRHAKAIDWWPTKYCKRLYLDVTSTNQGKLTWNTIKPIIQGKILYTPSNAETDTIVRMTNETFEEMSRLKNLSKAAADILLQLRTNSTFQQSFESLLKLARSPIVKSFIGDDFNIADIESAFNYVRTNQLIFDIVVTIKNLLECLSVDRFEAVNSTKELQNRAYQLNQKRLFLAAINFENIIDKHVKYRIHMDTDNTQPTFENRNRFWFPGPASSMLVDLKYHRGFVQLMQMVDIGIIKYKYQKLFPDYINNAATEMERATISVHTTDDFDIDGSGDSIESDEIIYNDELWNETTTMNILPININSSETEAMENITTQDPNLEKMEPITEANYNLDEKHDSLLLKTTNEDQMSGRTITKNRKKRQSLLNILSSIGSSGSALQTFNFDIDQLQYYTKQFPYPAYTNDLFKRGLYLAQAVQVSFCLGLIVAVAISVRERIWMRESRNSMLMRSMGMHRHSEVFAWVAVTFVELLAIFTLTSIVLYLGGILSHTNWIFMMMYCMCFASCVIAFCYMCSNFFMSANIGAVAASLLFFITFSPYIIVLLFDSKLNLPLRIIIDLSLTTAFAKGWAEIMRMELQQEGMGFSYMFNNGIYGSECTLSFIMLVVDLLLYVAIGYTYQYFKKTDLNFIKVDRAQLNGNLGASLGNVTKIYNNKFVVTNLSLDFARNEVTCLLGRNGAGKSTILKLLTGQCVQTSGRVHLASNDSNPGTDNVGVCSQDNILIPNLTAREHLELYIEIKLGFKDDEQVNSTLKSLNFGKYENYFASQLSGGYKRRLCVAIAFIGSPSVVVLDEPCNGVDAKARKNIWQLIEHLRIGRTVIFATHFLDEAKYLSDTIVFMRNGSLEALLNQEAIRRLCTSHYTVSMYCSDEITRNKIIEDAQSILSGSQVLPSLPPHNLKICVGYEDNTTKNAVEFLKYLQNEEAIKTIADLTLNSDSLDEEFNQLNQGEKGVENYNVSKLFDSMPHGTASINSIVTGPANIRQQSLGMRSQMYELFWKRLRNFSRNYRLLFYVLLLPGIFEVCALWFVSYRLEDDFDTVLPLSRSLYANTMQMLSVERSTNLTTELYDHFKSQCTDNDFGFERFECRQFKSSREAFYWILNSMPAYREQRYGGYSINGTGLTTWYNNKGYHAMMGWLNDLNTELLRITLNDTEYSINMLNEPWKLGFVELTTSSVLRQAGDSCMVFILLIAFGLVVAAASVYLVNERTNGEKLQQRLSGVSNATYWLVAFIWDYFITLMALTVFIVIVLIFNMPVFTDRQQLWGIILLSLIFSLACVPAVHVAEKLFSDSSISIVTIFCANMIIPLVTMGIILILGVVGDGPVWDFWRHGLNRLFLIFPQHALGDGLLEITKNYMVALVFKRYDIDSYKNPINSDLLSRHLISLILLTIFFLTLNMLLEKHILQRQWYQIMRYIDCKYKRDLQNLGPLQLVSLQSTYKNKLATNDALSVDNLCLAYKRGKYAVRNVYFSVKQGECFGLLGKNGAGKSTIFKMLTKQLEPNVGKMFFQHPDISYCPQTNPLDPLLTVTECIAFYGRLRNLKNISQHIENLLNTYELLTYRNVLVKNLSGGNRRKLTMAVTCCGYTPTVLLDEPTSDMDPVTRTVVYRIIGELLKARRAVVLTSHSVSEIEHLCTHVAVIKDGQIVTNNTPDELNIQYGGYYNVSLYCGSQDQTIALQLIREKLPKANDIQHFSNSIRFLIKVHSGEGDPNISLDLPNTYPALSELFLIVRSISTSFERAVPFAINRCHFDTVLEHVLDISEEANMHIHASLEADTASSQLTNAPIDPLAKSEALSGSLSTGYVHCGYEETST